VTYRDDPDAFTLDEPAGPSERRLRCEPLDERNS
jgi:hypothetical protein